MDIIYKDLDGKIITANQVEGYYSKIYQQNGFVKRIDRCYNADIERIEYVKEKNESDSNIAAQFNSLPKLYRLEIIMQQSYGSYKIYNGKAFNKNSSGQLVLSTRNFKQVINSIGDRICTETIDSTISLSDTEYRTIGKSYDFYHDGVNYAHLQFVFKPDGSLDYMEHNPDIITNDDQDIEHYDLHGALAFMTELNFADPIKNWYVSSVFLPPL